MPVDQAEATEAKAVSVTKVTDTALPENILRGGGLQLWCFNGKQRGGGKALALDGEERW